MSYKKLSLYERLTGVMPIIKLAIEMAKMRSPGGRIELGIVISKEHGHNPGGSTGVVAARFKDEFFDDVAQLLGVHKQPGWVPPEEGEPFAGKDWKDQFVLWQAGYFSWVEEAEWLPKDVDDLMRMVRDAFEAGRSCERTMLKKAAVGEERDIDIDDGC